VLETEGASPAEATTKPARAETKPAAPAAVAKPAVAKPLASPATQSVRALTGSARQFFFER